MIDLPLFPLNTVLFPNMPLRLHIFEDRYKLMINECLEADKPFGVVLIEQGEEAMGKLATPHLIGTTAHITQLQKLQFGRMNLLAIGKDRFRVNALYHDRPYLWGKVDLIPFIHDDRATLRASDARLRPLVSRYLASLTEVGFQFDESQLPTDTLGMALLAAIALQADNAQKQSLLESIGVTQLTETLIHLYRKEVTFLNILLSPPTQDDDSNYLFSLN